MAILAELTKEKIEKIQPLNNNVLIKLDRKQDEIKFKSGVKLHLDTSYEPEKHAPVTGWVIAVPDKLRYGRNISESMPWDTDIEVQVGDYVICYYMASIKAFTKHYARNLTDEEGNNYIFVSYKNLYVAKRKVPIYGKYVQTVKPDNSSKVTYVIMNGKHFQTVKDNGCNYAIIPLNGYCIAEAMPDHEYEKIKAKYLKMRLKIPKMIERKLSGKMVTIWYVGNSNKGYREPQYSDDNINISPWDVVLIRRHSDISLEYDLHATLQEGKNFLRIQRCHMYGTVN